MVVYTVPCWYALISRDARGRTGISSAGWARRGVGMGLLKGWIGGMGRRDGSEGSFHLIRITPGGGPGEPGTHTRMRERLAKRIRRRRRRLETRTVVVVGGKIFGECSIRQRGLIDVEGHRRCRRRRRHRGNSNATALSAAQGRPAAVA